MTMQFNKKATALVLAGALTITALPLNLNFASEQTRLDYAKSVINQSGMTLLTMPKKNATETDNYLYTAMKNGLFKGISFDFDGAITEEEKAIMQENAGLQAVENETVESTLVTENTETQAQNNTQLTKSLSDFEWTTPYGTIKQPSDLNTNADIWSDEEFHEMLKHDVETDSPGEGYFRQYLHINREGEGTRWYYNPENRHFFFLVFAIEGEDYWVDVDEITDGRFFQTMKAVLYNAKKYNMHLTMTEINGKGVHITAGVKDRGDSNIVLIFTYDPRDCDEIYGKIDGYDATTMDIIDEWHFENLFDYALYRETTGEQLYTLSTQERIDYFKSFAYTESCYTDFLYGVLNQLYGSDSLEIYHKFMYEYMYTTDSRIANDIETTNSHMSETTNHILFKYDPPYYDNYYAVINK